MSGSEKKPGRVRLLELADAFLKKLGWREVPGLPPQSRANSSGGWSIIWVVVQKPGMGEWEDKYEQPLIIENLGAIVLLIDQQGRIGLVQNFRMVGERFFPDAGVNYIRRLTEEEGAFARLLSSLGEWVWEAPRGLAPPSSDADDHGAQSQDATRFVLKVAQLESAEEAGVEVEELNVLGWLNPNTTFFSHAQAAVRARVIRIGEQKPEDREILGRVKFFTLAELREMADHGKLQDGMTLALLALAGVHF